MNEYDDLIKADKQSEFRSSVYVAAQQKPDEEAVYQKMADRWGLPVDTVRAKRPELEMQEKIESFDYEKAIKENPKLSEFFANPKNAAVAQDDFNNLSGLEKLMAHGKDYAGALGQGVIGQGIGSTLSGVSNLIDVGARAIDRPVRAMFGDRVANAFWYEPARIGGVATDPFQALQDAGKGFKQIGEAMAPPKERQTLGTDVVQGIGQLGSQIALYLLTGGTATTAALYAQGADIMADKTAKDNADPALRDTAILAGGAVTALTEKYGLDKILNRMPPQVKNRTLRFIADKLAAGGIEAAQEFTEGLLHDVTRRVLTNEDAKLLEGVDREMTAAGLSAAIVRSALGVRGLRSAQQTEDFFTALGDSSKASTLRERLPERFQALVERYTQDGPAQNVFVPAERFVEYFQSVGMDPQQIAAEAGAKNLDEALATGGDIVIPMANFATTIAPTDHLQGLMQDLRLRQDELTIRETRLEEANRDESDRRLQDEIARINQAATEDGNIDTAIQQIIGDVEGQLLARYDASTARNLATVMRGIAVLAQRANPDMNPVEAAQQLWAQYGLDIRANPLPKILTEGRDFDATIDPLLDRLRTGQGIPAQTEMFGESLLPFIKRIGGIRPGYGELKDADVGTKRKDDMVVREGGRALDEIGALAAEAGYFQPDETGTVDETTLLNAIAAELSGAPTYSIQNENAEAIGLAGALEELDKFLADLGVDLKAMDNTAVKAMMRSSGGQEFFQAEQQAEKDAVRAQYEGTDKWMQAPNGKPTNLNEDQWLTVRTPSFKNWFGDWEAFANGKDGTGVWSDANGEVSKVVDENGEPLVVYHGTKEDILRFDLSLAGTSTDSGGWGRGIYFTEDADYAAVYAGRAEGSNILPVYVALKNPMVVDVGARSKVIRDFGLEYPGGNPSPEWSQRFADAVKARGHDGVLVTMGGKPAEIVAFRPEQIKSAIGNAGTFDPSNPSILYQSEQLDEATGLPLNLDGTVTVYHHTSKDKAERIAKTGKLVSAAEPDVYVTTRRETDTGYGDTSIAIRVKPELLQIDDEFSDGRVDYRINTGKPAGSVAVEVGEYQLNQGDQSGKRGSIEIGADRKMRINLFEKANLSTFVHEAGHFYLEVLGDLAQAETSSAEVKDDYAKILKFLGVDSRSQITTAHHEKFARANEAYLMEGKAPAPELRGVFQRIRAWMKLIYRQLKNLDVELSNEVRGVFDRIYATDAEIEQASREASIPHLLTTAAEAGMTEAEFEAYRATIEDTTVEAKEDLQTKLMRIEKLKREAWWKEERARVAEEVGADYDALPAAQAMERMVAKDSDVKLNRDQLIARYGEGITKRIARGYGEGKGAVYAEDGIDIDTAAEMLGFNSADDMVEALANLPNRKRFIAAESDRIMGERHGDLLNDIAIADEAMLALHNDKREQVLRIELRALQKRMRDVAPVVKAERDRQRAERDRQRAERRAAVDVARTPAPAQLRQMAAGMVGQKEVRDLNPYSYLVAERKAANKAFEAMAKGDLETAFTEKQRELLNHYLYREALKAKQETDKIVSYLKGFESAKKRGELGKAGADYLDQIDGLLERYELKKVSNIALVKRESLAAWLQQQEAEGNAVSIPLELANATKMVNWRTVPVDELRALRDAVKNIDHLARLKNKLLRKGEAIDFAKVVDELLESADASGLKSTGELTLPSRKEASLAERGAAAWRKFDASHLKVEQIVEWLDGGKIDGPWARYFFDLAAEAQTQEYDLHKLVTSKIQELSASMPKAWRDSLDERTTVRLPGFANPVTRYTLISIALNMGNEQNMQRLRDGYGWSQDDFNAIRQALSTDDMKFVQGTWDAIELLWPYMAELEKRMSGLEPVKVVAMPFEHKGVEYRGGYFPLVYDPKKSGAGEKQASETESVQSFVAQGYGRANTNRGATMQRVENLKAPVLLDYEQVLSGHLAKVIKDISHREAVLGINKILTNPAIKESLIDKLGEARYTEMRQWLQVLVNDRTDTLTGGKWQARLLMATRTNLAIVSMGWKVSTMLAQFAGFGPSMDTVKPMYLGKAMIESTRKPVETWSFVKSKSGEMRNRANTLERDVKDALNRMRGEGGMAADVRRTAFYLTAMADRIVSVPTWLGGYNQALAEGKSEEDAIRAGDRAVRLSQGGGGAKDLAAVQRNGELMKMITMFYTPFNVLYARLRDVGNKTAQEGIGYLPAAAARLIGLVILPAVLGELLTGRGPDEDEDEVWWAIRKMLLYPLATVPLVRDLSGYLEAGMINAAGDGKMGYAPNFRLSPIVGAIEKLIKLPGKVADAATGDKPADTVAWDAFEASGLIFGLPTGQTRITGEYLEDLLTGDAEPENAMELLRDSLFKRPRN